MATPRPSAALPPRWPTYRWTLLACACVSVASHAGALASAEEPDVSQCVTTVERLLGVRFVRIAPGRLEKIPYPTTESCKWWPPSEPPSGETYELRIIDPFYIATTEVSCQQWERVMKTQPWNDAEPPRPLEGNHPATVSFYEAMEFCRRLTGEAGGNAARVRLPLEIEWEYACRAGTRTCYSFGDDPNLLDDFAWHQGNCRRALHPVGTKAANPWGLRDMHGNALEWCADLYGSEYPVPDSYKQQSKGDQTNPEYADWGRSVRGGGTFGLPYRYRSDFRVFLHPENRNGCAVRLVISSKSDGHHQGFYVPEWEATGEPSDGADSQ